MTDMYHLNMIDHVARLDLEEVRRKEATYKGSWKKRGGVGAFMMAARKWDRLEGMAEEDGYDIFSMLNTGNGEDGSALAEVRDLRRYLLLIEAEHMAQLVGQHKPGTPEDGGHHGE